jgi:hypothetical protein
MVIMLFMFLGEKKNYVMFFSARWASAGNSLLKGLIR